LPCARRIISTLLHRAYRLPVNEPDLKSVMAFYASGRREGELRDRNSGARLKLILASPKFRVFASSEIRRTCRPEAYTGSAVSSWRRVLSFFLWSSNPGR